MRLVLFLIAFAIVDGVEAQETWQVDIEHSLNTDNNYVPRAKVVQSEIDTGMIHGQCYLVRAGLQDILSLAIDSSKQTVRALSVQPVIEPPVAPCLASDAQLMIPNSFNTTVRVINVLQGPSPETQAWLQKIEKEKQERQRGEDPDNRSFLQKYWMYILPVVIFFMISNAVNPEPQQAAR